MKAKRYDRQNPVFARAQTGVPTNHSSSVPSTDHEYEGDHAQSDDELQDVSPPEDPNISGMTPTEDCYTFQAGPLDGWQENDDYRSYFEQSRGCTGMLSYDDNDSDYDDNGGMPLAIGHAAGHIGPKHGATGPGDEPLSGGFSLGIIKRRI
jgi:hypothetical protein